MHAPKHALRARHCYNHLAVIIARENEVLNQLVHAIFDIWLKVNIYFLPIRAREKWYSLVGFTLAIDRAQLKLRTRFSNRPFASILL